MGVFVAFFGCRGDAGFKAPLLGVSRGDAGFSGPLLGASSGVGGFNVAMLSRLVREKVLPGSSPVEWCNRFVSFGVGYALSWSGGSSCPVGWGVSRDLVRMSRLR